MRYQNWKETGKYFSFKGHKIFYKMEGQGEPLLLIHGFPTSSWDWWKIWPELIKKYTVIAPDMIGFGFSDKPTNYHYSIHDQADLHEFLMVLLGVKKFHLLVHDYGNSVGQELLARHLETKNTDSQNIDIQSICFLNGGLFPEMHKAKLIQKLLISPIGFLLSKLTSKKTFKKTFHDIFGEKAPPTDQEIDEFWSLIEYNNGKANMHKLIRYMSDRKQHRERWVNAIQNPGMPVRLIDGPEDPVSGRHLAEYYQKMIKNPDVILLERVGHYPQTENPEGVLKHYFEFREK